MDGCQINLETATQLLSRLACILPLAEGVHHLAPESEGQQANHAAKLLVALQRIGTTHIKPYHR